MIKSFNKEFFRKNKSILFFEILLMLCSSILTMSFSISISSLLDQIITQSDLKINFLFFTLGIVLFFLVKVVSGIMKDELFEKYQNSLLIHTLDKNIRAYTSHEENQDEYAQQLINMTQKLAAFYIQTSLSMIECTVMIVLSFTALLMTNCLVSLSLLIVIVLLYLIIRYCHQQMTRLEKDILEKEPVFFNTAESYIRNNDQVKFYNLFHRVYHDIRTAGQQLMNVCFKQYNKEAQIHYFFNITYYCYMFIFILASRQLSFGKVVYIVSILSLLFEYLRQANQFLLETKKSTASIEAFNANFNDVEAAEKKQDANDIIHTLTINNYLSKRQKCSAQTWSFNSGNAYVITGENGVGKSTFFQSLIGFYNDYSGNILINHKPAEARNLQQLLGHSLFYMSQSSELLEYIDSTESTITFSRGEAQKILWREIEKSLPTQGALILLDEPTASLDEAAKKMLIERIEELKEHHMILIISHDPIFNHKWKEVKFQ